MKGVSESLLSHFLDKFEDYSRSRLQEISEFSGDCFFEDEFVPSADHPLPQLLSTFGSLGKHCVVSILHSLLAWRQKVRQKEVSVSRRTVERNIVRSRRMSESIDNFPCDRRLMFVDFVFSTVVLSVLEIESCRKLTPQLSSTLRGVCFETYMYYSVPLGKSRISTEEFADNRKNLLNAFANIIGRLSRYSFREVADAYIAEMKEVIQRGGPSHVGGVALGGKPDPVVFCGAGKSIVLNVANQHGLQDSVDFMRALSAIIRGGKKTPALKHALCDVVVSLMETWLEEEIPVNVDVSLLHKVFKEMSLKILQWAEKAKHSQAALPAATMLACSSPRDTFLASGTLGGAAGFDATLTLVMKHAKDKGCRHVYVDCIRKLVMTFLRYESSTPRLQRVSSAVFAAKRIGSPLTEATYQAIVSMVLAAARRKIDFAVQSLIIPLLQEQQNVPGEGALIALTTLASLFCLPGGAPASTSWSLRSPAFVTAVHNPPVLEGSPLAAQLRPYTPTLARLVAVLFRQAYHQVGGQNYLSMGSSVGPAGASAAANVGASTGAAVEDEKDKPSEVNVFYGCLREAVRVLSTLDITLIDSDTEAPIPRLKLVATIVTLAVHADASVRSHARHVITLMCSGSVDWCKGALFISETMVQMSKLLVSLIDASSSVARDLNQFHRSLVEVWGATLAQAVSHVRRQRMLTTTLPDQLRPLSEESSVMDKNSVDWPGVKACIFEIESCAVLLMCHGCGDVRRMSYDNLRLCHALLCDVNVVCNSDEDLSLFEIIAENEKSILNKSFHDAVRHVDLFLEEKTSLPPGTSIASVCEMDTPREQQRWTRVLHATTAVIMAHAPDRLVNTISTLLVPKFSRIHSWAVETVTRTGSIPSGDTGAKFHTWRTLLGLILTIATTDFCGKLTMIAKDGAGIANRKMSAVERDTPPMDNMVSIIRTVVSLIKSDVDILAHAAVLVLGWTNADSLDLLLAELRPLEAEVHIPVSRGKKKKDGSRNYLAQILHSLAYYLPKPTLRVESIHAHFVRFVESTFQSLQTMSSQSSSEIENLRLHCAGIVSHVAAVRKAGCLGGRVFSPQSPARMLGLLLDWSGYGVNSTQRNTLLQAEWRNVSEAVKDLSEREELAKLLRSKWRAVACAALSALAPICWHVPLSVGDSPFAKRRVRKGSHSVGTSIPLAPSSSDIPDEEKGKSGRAPEDPAENAPILPSINRVIMDGTPTARRCGVRCLTHLLRANPDTLSYFIDTAFMGISALPSEVWDCPPSSTGSFSLGTSNTPLLNEPRNRELTANMRLAEKNAWVAASYFHAVCALCRSVPLDGAEGGGGSNTSLSSVDGGKKARTQPRTRVAAAVSKDMPWGALLNLAMLMMMHPFIESRQESLDFFSTCVSLRTAWLVQQNGSEDEHDADVADVAAPNRKTSGNVVVRFGETETPVDLHGASYLNCADDDVTGNTMRCRSAAAAIAAVLNDVTASATGGQTSASLLRCQKSLAVELARICPDITVLIVKDIRMRVCSGALSTSAEGAMLDYLLPWLDNISCGEEGSEAVLDAVIDISRSFYATEGSRVRAVWAALSSSHAATVWILDRIVETGLVDRSSIPFVCWLSVVLAQRLPSLVVRYLAILLSPPFVLQSPHLTPVETSQASPFASVSSLKGTMGAHGSTNGFSRHDGGVFCRSRLAVTMSGILLAYQSKTDEFPMAEEKNMTSGSQFSVKADFTKAKALLRSFGRRQMWILALTMAADVAFEVADELREEAPIFAHAAILGMSDSVPMVFRSGSLLLAGMLRSLYLAQPGVALKRKEEFGENTGAASYLGNANGTSVSPDSVEILIERILCENTRMWPPLVTCSEEDRIPAAYSSKDVFDLDIISETSRLDLFTGCLKQTVAVLRVCDGAITSRWANMALQWASVFGVSSEIRKSWCGNSGVHVSTGSWTALASLYIFRGLQPHLDRDMSAVLLHLLRMSLCLCNQRLSLAVLRSIRTSVEALPPAEFVLHPQIFWASVAMLQVENVATFHEAARCIRLMCSHLDTNEDPMFITSLLTCLPEETTWPLPGLQPLVLKGLTSSATEPLCVDLLSMFLILPIEPLIDPTPARLVLNCAAVLPFICYALDAVDETTVPRDNVMEGFRTRVPLAPAALARAIVVSRRLSLVFHSEQLGRLYNAFHMCTSALVSHLPPEASALTFSEEFDDQLSPTQSVSSLATSADYQPHYQPHYTFSSPARGATATDLIMSASGHSMISTTSTVDGGGLCDDESGGGEAGVDGSDGGGTVSGGLVDPACSKSDTSGRGGGASGGDVGRGAADVVNVSSGGESRRWSHIDPPPPLQPGVFSSHRRVASEGTFHQGSTMSTPLAKKSKSAFPASASRPSVPLFFQPNHLPQISGHSLLEDFLLRLRRPFGDAFFPKYTLTVCSLLLELLRFGPREYVKVTLLLLHSFLLHTHTDAFADVNPDYFSVIVSLLSSEHAPLATKVLDVIVHSEAHNQPQSQLSVPSPANHPPPALQSVAEGKIGSHGGVSQGAGGKSQESCMVMPPVPEILLVILRDFTPEDALSCLSPLFCDLEVGETKATSDYTTSLTRKSGPCFARALSFPSGFLPSSGDVSEKSLDDLESTRAKSGEHSPSYLYLEKEPTPPSTSVDAELGSSLSGPDEWNRRDAGYVSGDAGYVSGGADGEDTTVRVMQRKRSLSASEL
eukprot:Rmarinus@m.1872